MGVCLHPCLSARLPACQPAYSRICLSACLSLNLSAYLPVGSPPLLSLPSLFLMERQSCRGFHRPKLICFSNCWEFSAEGTERCLCHPPYKEIRSKQCICWTDIRGFVRRCGFAIVRHYNAHAHTHTQINTYKQTHTYIRRHTPTVLHIHAHMYSLVHTHIHIHAPTYSPGHKSARTRIRTNKQTHARTHTSTHKYTHTLARTHSHTRARAHTHPRSSILLTMQ